MFLAGQGAIINHMLPKGGQFCGAVFISDYATVCQASALLCVCQKTATDGYCNSRKELVNTGRRGEGWKKEVYWYPGSASSLSEHQLQQIGCGHIFFPLIPVHLSCKLNGFENVVVWIIFEVLIYC